MTTNANLLPFVPEIVRRQLRDQTALHSSPFEKSFEAVVMFADISGFTPLAERLSEERNGGAERIGEILTDCFGELIELISAYGGEVFKFAGDATLAFWIGDENTDLRLETLHASQCGLDVQRKLDDRKVDTDDTIRLRLSVAAGPVRVLHVGGIAGRWECVVAGDPLSQIEVAHSLASPGQVVLSRTAADFVRSECVLTPLNSGISILDKMNLADQSYVSSSQKPDPPIDAILRAYIPRSVLAQIDAGQAAWLAEFRHVTIMFVGISNMDYQDAGALDELQSAVASVQETVYKHEGSINQLIVEDKGTTLIAAWGHSLHSHADDAVRALRAARHIMAGFSGEHRPVSIGVTSGRVFTGIRGNERRSEFGLIGNVVNLCGRLMMAAKNSILCDSEVRVASRRDFIFKTFSPRTFKGISQPVPVFSPLAERRAGRNSLIGRNAERESLRSALADLEKQSKRAVRLLVGDAGIGKSRLIQNLLEQTQSSRVRSLLGSGDSYERSTPYYPWRVIISALFDLDGRQPTVSDQRTILDILDREPGLRVKAPLLNDLFEFGLEESDVTRDMSSKGRAEGIRELLIQLLNHAARQSPTMIVIEDAHWIDSTSWALAAEVADRVDPLLLIVTMRPIPQGEVHSSYRRILDNERTDKLHIDPLNDDESLALACHRLEADALPEEVASLIKQKAEGHPFFTEQFVLALRDQNLLEIVQGECRIAEGVSDLQGFRFPNDVQGVVTGRIDQLPTNQQLTLKVASVIGREFDSNLLKDIHPLDILPEELSEQLSNMVHLELISVAANETGVYKFNHSITQDVAYELLPFAQRNEFHRRVGTWIEAHPSADKARDFSLLAHHWSEAQEFVKGTEYLEKAGDRSLAQYANKEAIRYFESAIAIVRSAEAQDTQSVSELRLANWHRKLGDAYWKLGDTKSAIEYLSASLRLLGHSIPASRAGKIATVLYQALSQVSHLAFSHRYCETDLSRQETLVEASRTAGLLAWIQIVRQDSLGVMHASLLATNLADKADRTSVLSTGILGYSTYTMGLRRLAGNYFDRAKVKGKEQNDLAEMAMMQIFHAQSLFGNGDVERSCQVLDEAADIADRIGDRLLAARTRGTKSSIYSVVGDFEKVKAYDAQAFEQLRGEPSGDVVYFHLTEFNAEIMLGPGDELLRLPDRFVPKINAGIDPDDLLPQSCLHGLLALVFSRAGHLDRAMEYADRTMDLLGGSVAIAPAAAPPYRYPLEVYLDVWQQLLDQPQKRLKGIKRKVRRSLKYLRGFARIFPVHRSRLHLYLGRIAWLNGKHNRAQNEWNHALDLAVENSMTYDEGLALLELVRSSPIDSEVREKHVRRAISLFRNLGFRPELSDAEALQKQRA